MWTYQNLENIKYLVALFVMRVQDTAPIQCFSHLLCLSITWDLVKLQTVTQYVWSGIQECACYQVLKWRSCCWFKDHTLSSKVRHMSREALLQNVYYYTNDFFALYINIFTDTDHRVSILISLKIKRYAIIKHNKNQTSRFFPPAT